MERQWYQPMTSCRRGGASLDVHERAKLVIPGGVNSPVRSWDAVGGKPVFIARGDGARVIDENGRSYLDFVCSWGPLIFGHVPAQIQKKLVEAVSDGTTFGAPTLKEVELAELVAARIPSVDKVRLVSSGTEATMSAVRLARGFTGKTKILKFDGCYHGHVDSLLVKAGSGVASLSLPETLGIPEAFASATLVAPFNDLAGAIAMIKDHQKDLAGVIVEPVCGNMGVIPPEPGFLEGLREITSRHGIVLIFDEVITGFRLAPGGAQERYGVMPDLTCLGKILGGGLPVGAFGGRRDIMDLLAPDGPVYQAGTLSGNPLAVTAGIETLKLLGDGDVYGQLEAQGNKLAAGLEAVLFAKGFSGTVNHVGSMLTLFFGPSAVKNAEDARRSDRERFSRFFHAMLENGIYVPPSPFETVFVSMAHSDDDIATMLEAFEEWSKREAYR